MMEVSGVLMSWDTLVISSTLVRSALMPSSTAFWMPVRIMFSCMAQSYRLEVGGMWFTAFKLPPYISAIWASSTLQSRKSRFRAKVYQKMLPITPAAAKPTTPSRKKSRMGDWATRSRERKVAAETPSTPTITAKVESSLRRLRCSKPVKSR